MAQETVLGAPADTASQTSAHTRAVRLVVALGVALILLSAIQKAYRLTLPTDGWQPGRPSPSTRNLTFGQNMLGLPSALRPGDELLAVEGHSVGERDGLSWEERALRGEFVRPEHWEKGATLRYTVHRDGRTLDLAVPIGGWSLAAIARSAAEQLLLPVPIFLLGCFVLRRRPNDLAARLLFLYAAAGVVPTISWIGSPGGLEEAFVSPHLAMLAAFCSHSSRALLGFPLAVALMLSFPGARAPLRRHPRPIAAVLVGVPVLLVVLEFFSLPAPYLLWVIACLLAQLVWLGYAVLTTREPGDARAQVRWVAFGMGFNIASTLAGALVVAGVLSPALAWLTLIPGSALLFLALAIAILRHRLFAIDVILRRTLVYGALSAFVVGTYVLVVSYLGALFRSADSIWPSLVATSLVAVLFQPLRGRLQQAVNRLVYGERDDPSVALARLGRQLGGTLAPEKLLTTIAATIQSTLRLSSVRIALWDGVAGATIPGERPFPLSYAGEMLGELRVSPRAGETSLSAADVRLLDDLARQAGVAVHAAQTTVALQRARERLVITREEERHRLRRDLHDGLGPALASQALTVDTAALLLDRDPQAAATLMREVKLQSQAAIAEIRRIVYGLRPPALDDLGLASALQEHVRHHVESGLDVEMVVTEPLPRLPAAVEVAVYHIALEALTNVVRHAQARRCVLALTVDTMVVLTVQDNGRGVSVDRRAGVGLTSMRERAEELGGQFAVTVAASGGTMVQAVLPLVERTTDGAVADPYR